MPKKFVGENSKATVAKARKSAIKEEKQAIKQKQLDDEYWKESDKHVLRKQQRKEVQERKKQTMVDRKAENKALLEQEIVNIKKTSKVTPITKITRAQVSENLVNNTAVEKEETHLETPLEENLNRIVLDAEEAHTINDAIILLSSKDRDIDKHPEKRMKAAYTAFEECRLQSLKQEQPSLRLSQLKQIIFKEWQKSAENPLNA